MQGNPLAPDRASRAPRALILASHAGLQNTIRQVLAHAHWQLDLCRDYEQFRCWPERTNWSLVIVAETAECMAVEVLAALKACIAAAQTYVVVVSEQPTAEAVLHYTQLGAMRYLAAPLDPLRLLEITEEVRQLAQHTASTAADTGPAESANPAQSQMIGSSPAMLELAQQLALIALKSDRPVFVTGETGTGKGVVAQQIHALSGRSGTFCVLNCATAVADLVESELFGHEKGAFTGASASKKGLWEEAANGTLFLDEITEAPPPVQAKLLRALQEGVIRRVGANHEIPVTARVIAASNREPEAAVRAGLFREDLFYRFGQVLRVPSLRERTEDIPLLIKYFAARVAARHGRELLVTPEAQSLLCAYHWPGNVRELESTLDNLATQHGHIILPEHVNRLLHPRSRLPETIHDAWWSALKTNHPPDWPPVRALRNGYVVRAFLILGKASAVAHYLEMDIRTVHTILDEEAKRLPCLQSLRESKDERQNCAA